MSIRPLEAARAEEVNRDQQPAGPKAPGDLLEGVLQVLYMVQRGFGKHHVIAGLAVIREIDVGLHEVDGMAVGAAARSFDALA